MAAIFDFKYKYSAMYKDSPSKVNTAGLLTRLLITSYDLIRSMIQKDFKTTSLFDTDKDKFHQLFLERLVSNGSKRQRRHKDEKKIQEKK
jgi:hypothetical protein